MQNTNLYLLYPDFLELLDAHMMESALSDRLMDCPRCGWRIPKILICSGRNNPLHEGLPFRSVSGLLMSGGWALVEPACSVRNADISKC
jgi:hypothetical protein